MPVNRMLGAALLIASTTIGVAMLALPLCTATLGLFPALGLFVICWGFMLISAYLILELTLAQGPGCNMMTMATNTLGILGKWITWSSYLLLLYALMAAHLSGLTHLLSQASSTSVSPWMMAYIVFFFSVLLYMDSVVVDYLNRFFISGVLASFFALSGFVAPHLQPALLPHVDMTEWWKTLPLLLVAFGYHIIIPSIRNYLNSEVTSLKKALLIGSLIPFCLYGIWEVLILGSIPLSHFQAILQHPTPEVTLGPTLDALTGSPWVSLTIQWFTAFTMVTSFIGVFLSLADFLSDALKLKRTQLGRLTTLVLTFIPPILFIELYPQGFLSALHYAGLFVAILLGILPCWMVWRQRYVLHTPALYASATAFISKPVLMTTLLFFLSVVVICFLS